MKNILVFGDSNSWGYDFRTYMAEYDSGLRMEPHQRWPGIVQQILGTEYHVIEDALNSRTCVVTDPYSPNREGLPALQMALDANAPLDMVLIHLGCNELKAYFNLSAGMIAAGAEMLVKAAKERYYGYPQPKILLIAPPPVDDAIVFGQFGFIFGPEAGKKSRELGALYREVAERQSVYFLDCGQLRFRLNDQDYLHYCVEDHQKLAKAVAEIVLDAFA